MRAGLKARYVGVFGLVFVSGVTALVYELVWFRVLSVSLGTTAPALAAVLSTFMGGLVLGSYLGGRWVDRWGRGVVVYAILEGFIGIYAFIFPYLISAMEQGYGAVYGSASPAVLHVLHFVLACLVLLLPSMAMGATLPAIVVGLHSLGRDTGRIFSLAYGVNTAGALCGAVLGGYLVLPLLGTSSTLVMTGTSNLVIAVIAFVLAQGLISAPVRKTSGPGPMEKPASPRILYLVAFVSGGVSLAAQVLWTRAMSMVFGSSVYTFAIILAVTLGAISVAALINRLMPQNLARSMKLVFASLLSAGFYFALSIWVLRYAPRLWATVLSSLKVEAFGATQLATTGLTFIVIFPATAALAMVLPATIGAYTSQNAGRPGGLVGRLYAANTLGAIVGSLLGVFVLLETLGPSNGLRALGVLVVVIGLLLTVREKFGRTYVLLGAVAAGSLLLTPGVEPLFLHAGIGANFRYFRGAGGKANVSQIDTWRLLYCAEGMDASVAVIDKPSGLRILSVNGKVVASTNSFDSLILRELGRLPVVAHGRPRNVLVVGLGTGMTAAAAGAFDSVEDVTVVEINPDIPKAARFFSEHNNGVMDDERVRIIREDGRTYIRYTGQRFDVITSDPIHPWTRGSSNLFTLEHFRNARAVLCQGGVMAQWVPLYALSVDDYFRIVNTFVHVFPHVALVSTGLDSVLLGSESSFAQQIMEVEGLVAVDETLRQAVANAGINDDDHLQLEYSAPRFMNRSEEILIQEVLRDIQQTGLDN